jgi:hypothetical protein
MSASESFSPFREFPAEGGCGEGDEPPCAMFSRPPGLIRVAAFSINKTIKHRSGLLFDLAQKQLRADLSSRQHVVSETRAWVAGLRALAFCAMPEPRLPE